MLRPTTPEAPFAPPPRARRLVPVVLGVLALFVAGALAIALGH